MWTNDHLSSELLDALSALPNPQPRTLALPVHEEAWMAQTPEWKMNISAILNLVRT